MTTTATISKFDSLYRNILLGKFFSKGWGNPDNMKRIFQFRKIISNRETCKNLVTSNHPIYIDAQVEQNALYKIFNGHFISPMVHYLPDLIPKEAQIARFQLILPNKWNHATLKPICLHFAGTGDHFFWKRRALMAKPLLKEYGIASIILENPFYGLRKPPDQIRSNLNNVSDIFIMGGCLVLEALALLHWCERMHFSPLCVTGISMGGHMASLAGANWHKPISIVPCLSWTTASCVFTQGVMSGAIAWSLLEDQYSSYEDQFKDELQKMIHSPEKKNVAFDAGRHFAKTFPSVFDSIFNGDILPVLSNKLSANKVSKDKSNVQTKKDTFDFMRGVMDECTHLGNFSTPVDPELTIVINATHDGYVPRDGLLAFKDLWPGSSTRYLDCGHVSAILFKLDFFRKAIADSIQMNVQKHYGTSLFNKPDIKNNLHHKTIRL